MKQEWVSENIMVVDDLLPSLFAKRFYKTLAQGIMWGGNLDGGTSLYSREKLKELGVDDMIFEQFQFASMERNVGVVKGINSDITHFIYYPLMTWAMTGNFRIKGENIQRCKINLQTKAPKEAKGKYNHPHVDVDPKEYNEDYYTAIYYANDSDGDTYFFNESYDFAEKDENLSKLTIKIKVSPKAGRLVVFPCSQVHAGAHPVNYSSRMVINYNFKIINLEKGISDQMGTWLH